MKKLICLLSLLSIISFNSFAQDKDSTWCSKLNHGFGVQLNPYLNEDVFTVKYRQTNFAIRYKFLHPSGYTFGPEVSGYWARFKNNSYRESVIKYGGFIRYSVLRARAVSPFVETRFYYISVKSLSDIANEIQKNNSNYVGGYGAIGLSIDLYKRKIFLDLMFKAELWKSFKYNYWLKQYEPSFRLNFHF